MSYADGDYSEIEARAIGQAIGRGSRIAIAGGSSTAFTGLRAQIVARAIACDLQAKAEAAALVAASTPQASNTPKKGKQMNKPGIHRITSNSLAGRRMVKIGKEFFPHTVPEDIAEWNRQVDARKAEKKRLARLARELTQDTTARVDAHMTAVANETRGGSRG